MSTKTTEDKDMEQVMGNLLRIGVIVAASVSLIGGVMYLLLHGGEPRRSYAVFKSVSPEYTSFGTVMQGVLHGNNASIMQLGVLLLIATPIARVIFSMLSFVKEKDYLYVVISAIVLGIIAFSIFGGVAA